MDKFIIKCKFSLTKKGVGILAFFYNLILMESKSFIRIYLVWDITPPFHWRSNDVQSFVRNREVEGLEQVRRGLKVNKDFVQFFYRRLHL